MRTLFTTAAASLLLAAASLAAPVLAADPVRGVTDTEIVIGSYTDLSGVTAVWGVNNNNAWRLAFEEANAKGGINGRKIKFITEDNQYQVPRSIQAANKLINKDGVFIMVGNDGTPMNNAVMPDQLEKGVPNVFPLTAARSMYEPYHKLKFGQFASYYDQMRAGVKYFVEKKGKKNVCAMTQDSDFGRDVLAGAVEQLAAMNMKLAGQTVHKPTDTDFNASLTRLRDDKCDLIVTGTIVKDTTLIISTARKMGWDVDMVGQFASYDTAVADAPGNVAEGYYAMTPGLYAYPDDPRPAVQEFSKKFKDKFGREPNFLGQMGYSAAQMAILGLQRAGRDLTMDSFVKGMESIDGFVDIFGNPPAHLSATNHHASTESFLAVVKGGRWVAALPEPLGY